jgi:hypothetical protein
VGVSGIEVAAVCCNTSGGPTPHGAAKRAPDGALRRVRFGAGPVPLEEVVLRFQLALTLVCEVAGSGGWDAVVLLVRLWNGAGWSTCWGVECEKTILGMDAGPVAGDEDILAPGFADDITDMVGAGDDWNGIEKVKWLPKHCAIEGSSG